MRHHSRIAVLLSPFVFIIIFVRGQIKNFSFNSFLIRRQTVFCWSNSHLLQSLNVVFLPSKHSLGKAAVWGRYKKWWRRKGIKLIFTERLIVSIDWWRWSFWNSAIKEAIFFLWNKSHYQRQQLFPFFGIKELLTFNNFKVKIVLQGQSAKVFTDLQ